MLVWWFVGELTNISWQILGSAVNYSQSRGTYVLDVANLIVLLCFVLSVLSDCAILKL
ncbi:hypothetical protein IV84_GL001611 [Pediococcus damnosus]|nr:hypothetical protein IV84_GL001611 [Pediococcus damnosus]